MTEFDNLKRNYAAAIQCGLAMGSGYQNATIANEIIHKFCETLVESSDYAPLEKQRMKLELEVCKETLSHEIDRYYHA